MPPPYLGVGMPFLRKVLGVNYVAVADPGFPTGAQTFEFGVKNLLLDKIFAENCMEMK